MYPYERFFNELSPAEQKALWEIKSVDDIKEVKRLALWMNDGIPCIGASINDVQLGFYWLNDGSTVLEAFYHLDEAAKLAIYNHLRQIRGADTAQALDGEDDFERREEDSDGAYDPYYGDSDSY